MGLKVNNNIAQNFQNRKSLRWVDPISPILFNIVAYILAIIIAREKEDIQVGGLIRHLVEGEACTFYNMPTTLFFMEHDLDKALN